MTIRAANSSVKEPALLDRLNIHHLHHPLNKAGIPVFIT